MSVKILNYCEKTYRPDPEKIVKHILERIPEKFLAGLEEVRLFDLRKKDYVGVRYVFKAKPLNHSIIEIYMDDPMLSGSSFFSILTLNFDFIMTINEHIEKYLQPRSRDEDILSYPTGMINYNWAYFGRWSPILTLFKIGNYLITRIQIFHRFVLYLANRVFKNNGNHK